MSLEFKNPPVNEVVIGVYFERPLFAFRNQHIGLFWEKIRDRFTKVQQQPPLGLPIDPGPPQIADEFFPMPRYWFISEDDTYVIQVDKGAFIFNWRQRGSNPYPGFENTIKPLFDRYYYLFDEFARRELDIPTISIGSCELSYLNRIESGEIWTSPKDTRKVIPSFVLPSIGLEESQLSSFSCQYRYVDADNLTISVSIRSGEVSSSPSLLLDIRTTCNLGRAAKYDADKWFNHAHNIILDRFTHSTSQKIQKQHWIHVEGSK